jgi:hypothetical protein
VSNDTAYRATSPTSVQAPGASRIPVLGYGGEGVSVVTRGEIDRTLIREFAQSST